MEKIRVRFGYDFEILLYSVSSSSLIGEKLEFDNRMVES